MVDKGHLEGDKPTTPRGKWRHGLWSAELGKQIGLLLFWVAVYAWGCWMLIHI